MVGTIIAEESVQWPFWLIVGFIAIVVIAMFIEALGRNDPGPW